MPQTTTGIGIFNGQGGNGGSVELHQVYLQVAGVAAGYTYNSLGSYAENFRTVNTYFRNTAPTGFAPGIVIYGYLGHAFITSTQIEGFVKSINIQGLIGNSQSSNNKIDCTGAPSPSSGIWMNNSATASQTPLGFGGNYNDISNCEVGIEIDGHGRVDIGVAWTGTGNTTAYKIEHGGTVVIRSDTTLTGTTEINIDGNTYTLSELRSFTPVRITNAATRSIIYQK